MFDILRSVCEVSGASGSEQSVAKYIENIIKPFCEECFIDNMGNVIAFKRGKQRAAKKVMLDAHMDEVGFIITNINSDGSLSFDMLGGVNIESIVAKRVTINGAIGVVQVKPIHLLKGDEARKMPDKASLTIDIGAKDQDDAKRYVKVGDIGTFYNQYIEFGDGLIKSKALDDRIGCAVLIDMIKSDLKYDAWFSFSVQEEIGLRGARVTTNYIEPDFAIAVETTTAADIAGMPENKQVCKVGEGAAVSFMDNSTLYERELFDLSLTVAKANNIKAQVKQAVSGGNNSGAIHLSKTGVRAITVSTPCRYLHSQSCVASKDDILSVRKLSEALLEQMATGEV